LVDDDKGAIEFAKAYFRYMPQRTGEKPAHCDAREARPSPKPISDLIPEEPNRGYDMRKVIDALIDEGSWVEIKKLFARELLTGFARLAGQPVGIVANQPMQKGGVLFNDSADKAARFIWLCDAFEIPLLFLADVPGFMIGTDVEKRGIIRHGAKMISAVSEATVPKISVIVRKAYGAGLYAMARPAYEPHSAIPRPSARSAGLGPQPGGEPDREGNDAPGECLQSDLEGSQQRVLVQVRLRPVEQGQRAGDRPRLAAQQARGRAQGPLAERKRVGGNRNGHRSEGKAPGLGEVRGEDRERAP